MNFLGHTHVALASGDDPIYVLGAVLPDLASMARVRIDRARSGGGALHEGIRCHIETDAAFHAHPVFRRGAAAIRADLAPLDLPVGASRAIGHIGWELLLDGTLVGSSTESAFQYALIEGERALPAIVAGDQPQWSGFLDRWKGLPDPRLRYDEPVWVAERLYLMLQSRPRLAFAEDAVPAVSRVLELHATPVAAVAAEMLDAMVTATTAPR
ncbi:MAG TPA: hypothetical protein VGO78_21350 [Acidimicrobiales bacterium]|nr:hypothetical protein [Acidimicrobiales bacterium]